MKRLRYFVLSYDESFYDEMGIHVPDKNSLFRINMDDDAACFFYDSIIVLDSRELNLWKHVPLTVYKRLNDFENCKIVVIGEVDIEIKNILHSYKSVYFLSSINSLMHFSVNEKNRQYVINETLCEIRDSISEKNLEFYKKLEKYSKSNETILLTGETGAGKNYFADEICKMSGRHSRLYETISIPDLTPSIIESQLFGTRKNSYTGAENVKGAFERNNGGTLHIAEIGEMPLDLQTKLLSVMDDFSVLPLGSEKKVKLDVRLIFSTNKNLAEMVKQGTFREDLFYRINVLNLEVPPLRDRLNEIPVLAEKFAKDIGKKLSDEVMQCLLVNEWKGNVRDLRNTIKRSAALCEGNTISKIEF